LKKGNETECEIGYWEDYGIKLFKMNENDQEMFKKYWQLYQESTIDDAGDILFWAENVSNMNNEYHEFSFKTLKEHQNHIQYELDLFYSMCEHHYLYKDPDKIEKLKEMLKFNFIEVVKE